MEKRIRLLAPLLLGLTMSALTGCDMGPRHVPAPAPLSASAAPVAPSPAAQAGEDNHPGWEDWSATLGDWRYLSNDLTPEAVFGAAGPALFVLRCDRPRARLVLERPARGASAEGGMIVRASGAERRLPAIALLPSAAAPFGGIMAQLGARDPLLDAIAFSRGKFIVAVGGAPDLVLPSWAEVSRVIEDCRAP